MLSKIKWLFICDKCKRRAEYLKVILIEEWHTTAIIEDGSIKNEPDWERGDTYLEYICPYCHTSLGDSPPMIEVMTLGDLEIVLDYDLILEKGVFYVV